ncbi:unnamed protein product [Orchesella dallaii]|uniref:Uncharacterized protein n=1 Tax=Orchesella dallaii TaxID=48710 RepID=A0ABP1PX13_9HEXA
MIPMNLHWMWKFSPGKRLDMMIIRPTAVMAVITLSYINGRYFYFSPFNSKSYLNKAAYLFSRFFNMHADIEQHSVDPVKTEDTISVITSSQPLSSPALPKDDIIIPSEKQTIQSQEKSQISSSPIQVPADVIQQQPDAASEPESIAQSPGEQVPQPPLSQDVPPIPTQQISQADTVQQEKESLAASFPDEQKPEVISLTSIDVSQSSTILPTDISRFTPFRNYERASISNPTNINTTKPKHF